jgi:hypothetical protein
MKILATISIIIMAFSIGCSAAWPKQCKGDWQGRMACQCKVLRFKAYPATELPLDATIGNNKGDWVVIPDCDGNALPVTTNAKNLKGCTVEK